MRCVIKNKEILEEKYSLALSLLENINYFSKLGLDFTKIQWLKIPRSSKILEEEERKNEIERKRKHIDVSLM